VNNYLPAQINYSVPKELLPILYLVIGFILGLFSTVFTEYFRKRRKKTEFRHGMRAELKQTLAMLNAYAYLLDYKINKEKLRARIALSREFNLHKEANPLVENPQFNELIKKDFTDKELDAFAAIRNQKKNGEGYDIYTTVRKVHCNFIQHNIASISLLNNSERSLLFNILRRLNIINEQISRLDFTFKKSYDSNISSENRKRLKLNYKSGCQFISDWSYKTAEEIARVLRQ